MKKLIYCSQCSKKNSYSNKDGEIRYHCKNCKSIHYQNPKPTATLICIKNDEILLVKRAFEPAKGEWSLPGGFIELGETPEDAAKRELKEETNLDGEAVQLIGSCSHFNSIFGDVLLLGLTMKIDNWENLIPGDDAQSAGFFKLKDTPIMAFECHNKILSIYKKSLSKLSI
ncbi:MAG: NUDIX hydrolase [Candidatus Marinimicrobia bacterium]|nr:NUDIX hydrolase [Candidatus Neomarinimicrobiota bacterium]|tara:strand:- start:3339 stop:3851 length:513 start_codon:yes stop_codon:yes gene_type:complete